MVQSQWRQEANFDTLQRAGHATCAWQGHLLIFGGRVTSTVFADCWAYSPATQQWSVWCEKWPCQPRSYHTATLVGDEVWLCGGGDTETVVGDILVFHCPTRKWRQPALTGSTALVRRTAHGACVHPQRPQCLLLFGGYGGEGGASTQDYRYLNDLVEINTRTGMVKAVRSTGTPPEMRAYHTFVPVGSCCYAIGGRTHDNRLIKAKQMLLVWESASQRWITPGMVGGELTPRSSHRAVAVPGGVLLFGGAGDKGVKTSDLQLLAVGQHGRLSWRYCLLGGGGGGGGGGGQGGAAGIARPQGRGAHAAEVVAGRLYVLGGYGEGRQYTGDCWSISLEAVGGCDAAPPSAPSPLKDAAAKQSGEGCRAGGEASQWREARRSRPAAAFCSEPQSGKRQRVGAAAAHAVRDIITRGGAGLAAAAALPASAPILELGCDSGQEPEAEAALPAAAAGAGAAVVGPGTRERQQQQQRQQQAVAVLACDQQLLELQRLQDAQKQQEQQAAAAAKQQQLVDLERQNAELREQCSHWRRRAENEQASARTTDTTLQNTQAQVLELQRQLSAAVRERDEALHKAAEAASKAEDEVQAVRNAQRRERSEREAADLQRDKFVDELRAELAVLRDNNNTLTGSYAKNLRLADKIQGSLEVERQKFGDQLKTAADERERFQKALQVEKEAAEAAQQARQQAHMRLDLAERALAEAQQQLGQHKAQLQTAEERARQSHDACQRAKDEADELRAKVQAAAAAEARWQAGKARAERLVASLQATVADMPDKA